MKSQLFKKVCLLLFLSGAIETKASIIPSEDCYSHSLDPINLIENRIDTAGETQLVDKAFDTLYIESKNKKIVKIYPGLELKVRSGITMTKGTVEEIHGSYLVLNKAGLTKIITYTDASALKIMNPNKGTRVFGGVLTALAYPATLVVALAFPGDLESIEIAGASGVAVGIGLLYAGDRLRGKRIRLKNAKISTEI